MAENTCTPPTPEQGRSLEIREAAERKMLDAVSQGIEDAAVEVEKGFKEAGLDFEPTNVDFFRFTVWQTSFVTLCGGDPETLQGGDPELGERILRKGRHIIDHHWRIPTTRDD